MPLNKVRWRLAVVAFLVAEASLIAAAYAWVAIYSYFIHPGRPISVYEQYAQTSSPYVALVLGIPVFFFACRWIAFRAPSAAVATALAVFGFACLVEIAVTLAADNPYVSPWLQAVNIPVKLLGCLLGARAVQKPLHKQAA